MAISTHRPVILLVEDSPDDVYFFSRGLRAAGIDCDLVHVTNGAAAIEYFEKNAAGAPPPDLVFLDLKLPIVSGFEVLEWIRAQSPERSYDIAVLSGSEQPADVERAFALGASAYYVKPVLVQQLKNRFHAWEERRNAHPGEGLAQGAARPIHHS